MSGKIHPPRVTYSPSFGKTYIIENVSLHIDYLDADQKAQFVELDTLRIYGGRAMLRYSFDFEKKLIGATIKGNASGSVKSDPLQYVKEIQLNHV
jgi:hypothetical protein